MSRRLLLTLTLTMLTSGCATASSASGTGAGAGAAQPGSSRTIQIPSAVLNRVDLPARALAVHNRYRAQAGVPPLQWSAQLAIAAQAYAQQLAATGRFAHSARETRLGQGENLWMGSAGAYSLETMLTHWGEERHMFRSGIFPSVTTTARWADVAHYTQMIWRGTTQVGCALHTGRGNDFLVCRYSPPGNRNGDQVP